MPRIRPLSNPKALVRVSPSKLAILSTAAGMVLLGTPLTAILVHWFGELGSAGFWLLGWLAAISVVRLGGRMDLLAIITLSSVLVFVFLAAEVVWIHWNIVGAESIGQAIGKLPGFLRQYWQSTAIGVLFVGFGIESMRRTMVPERPDLP